MKVIFLDIDGVLNSADYMDSLYFLARSEFTESTSLDERQKRFKSLSDKYGYLFDPRCKNYLEAIVNHTSAKIVISSTWRKNGIGVMMRMWKNRKLAGEIVGITPSRENGRGEEIQSFLDHNKNIESYVIIDDDDYDIGDVDHLVKTNNKFGLTLGNAEKAIRILNK